jgi:PIN domain nuclease of toxin-antitoxin system
VKKYLIDTNCLIWSSENSPFLSKKAKNIVENIDNQLFVSIASLWEIAIKVSIGKLKLSVDFNTFIDNILQSNITILPITYKETITVSELEFIHKDPFDRIIIAQTINNNLEILSSDEIFDEYIVKRIW